MLTGFICPDGGKTTIEDCLNNCRMGRRCCSKGYARFAAEERAWSGKPSCTQLLRGTRESYLRIKKGYEISPDDQVWAIIGRGSHASLEPHGEGSEVGMEFMGITGIPDNYEDDVLEDYKVWGSYKVMLILGYEAEKIPDTDEFGNVARYKSGEKKGQVKTRNIWNINPDKAEEERWEVNLQLNFYRMMIEAQPVKNVVKEMYLEVFVRDGNTVSAMTRNIDRPRYYIPIKRLPDDYVMQYFEKKRDALLHALKTDTMPPICDDRERWNGRKCDYCPVAKDCPGR